MTSYIGCLVSSVVWVVPASAALMIVVGLFAVAGPARRYSHKPD